MSEYCRKYSEEFWEAEGSRINIRILCEGHAAWETLDENGLPVDRIPVFQKILNDE